jgi:hypothetical protein
MDSLRPAAAGTQEGRDDTSCPTVGADVTALQLPPRSRAPLLPYTTPISAATKAGWPVRVANSTAAWAPVPSAS